VSERLGERGKRWSQKARAFWAEEGKKITSIVLVIGLPIVAKNGYDELDKRGLLRHSATMLVSADRDWWTGEFRTCYGVLGDDGMQNILNCSQGSVTRTLPVVFWGRTVYADRAREHTPSAQARAIAWNCQREVELLTCRAQ
jgi:hypothetical protein